MSRLHLTLQTITPLLMYGAYNKDGRSNSSLQAQPELRATSIRGVLRYWLRAVLGAEHNGSPSLVYEAESAILGNTGRGSRVGVRVLWRKEEMQPTEKQTVLPRKTSKGHLLQHTAFPPKSRFHLYLTTHPLDTGDVFAPGAPLIKALFLMTHFGGLGRRARRGSGNVCVRQADGYEGTPQLDLFPKDRDELAQHLREVANYITSEVVTLPYRPKFPVFAGNTAVVLVGKSAYPSYEDAFDELWRVSGSYHHEGGIFGGTRPRRASAIHMRVAETKAGCVPLQTILYSGHGKWKRMQEYIAHCQQNGFEAIYGDGAWEDWA